MPEAGIHTGSDLTQSQLLVWTGQQLRPDRPLYNMAVCFTIEGELDSDVFTRAWRSVVERSETLRTVVHDHEGTPSQEVLPGVDTGVRRLDFADHPRPEEAARAWAESACQHLFDPSRRLFETALLRLADDRWMWYLNQHHLITDAWSTTQVFRRVSDAYARLETSAVPDREPLASFRDYVEHESAVRASAEFHDAEAHWEAEFGQAREPAPLYGTRVRNPTTGSVRVACELGPERSRRIRALVNRPDISSVTPHLSVFNVFATTLAAYVLRVTGDRSPTFGALSHNRSTPAFKDTIGLLVEVFPMRAHVEPGASYVSLLDDMRSSAIAWLRYARPGASAARYHRQFNVVLNYVNATFPPFAGRPARTEWIHPGHGDSLHALRLHVHDFDDTGEFVLHFDFNEDVFGPPRRQEAIGHFLRLLDGFLDDPDQAVDEVELLSDPERRSLLVDGSANPSQPSVHDTIISRFEAQVARGGHHEAVRVAGEDSAITYGVLDQQANRLARRLRDLGADGTAPVALCMPPSPGTIVACLAALKAGAAFLPIDPVNPAVRIEQMLRDAGASTLVVDPEAAVELPAFGGPVLAWDQPDTDASRADPPDGEAGDTAYIYYTSGSTGTPKGVRCGNHGLLNLLGAFEAMGPLPERARATWWTSIGFDVAVYEVFSCLLYGHALHVVPASMRTDTAAYIDYLAEASIQSAYVPPFMVDALAEACEARSGAFDLRRVLVGVEPIPEQLLTRIQRSSSKLTLINGYGPTEATTCATLYRVGTDDTPDRTAPIGRPVTNNRVYVLNERGRPQPAGVPGEICIGGAGLALGYVNAPEEEARRFVPDRFSGTGRLYRTGDLGRMQSDGNLAFLGRIDRQLKVRGYRIEPGEVENALNRQPQIATSVVTGDDTGHAARPAKRLVAYVVPHQRASVDPTELRRQLRRDLPDYMLPAVFVVLDQMPLTPNGKVDREALPPPSDDSSGPGQPFAPPVGGVERQLVEIWRAVLGRDDLGVLDDFFDLGGDSVAAIQIAARAQQAGLALTATDVFDEPSVEALAKVTKHLGEGSIPEPDRSTAAAGAEYPLTPTQAGMLFHTIADPDPGVYTTQLSCAVEGHLDVDAFKAAWSAVIHRHDVLRTAFLWDGLDEPVQVVRPHVELPWTEPEWAGAWPELDEQERRERASQLLGDDRKQGFDLYAAPLLRMCLWQEDDARWRLVWSLHHLIADGWSMRVILDEVMAIYRSGTTEVTLDDPMPFRDYVRWLENQDSAAAEAVWRKELAGFATATPLVAPGSGAPRDGAGRRRADRQLSEAASRDLRRAAATQRVTPNTIVQGAWAIVLGRWARERDIVFGVTGSGRSPDLPGIERAVGLFLNTLPMRVDVDPRARVTNWLGDLQRSQLALRRVDFSSLAEIQRWSELPPGASLFDSIVVFENVPAAEETPADALTIGDVHLDEQSNYPLALLAFPGDRLELVMYYDGARYDADWIEGLLRQVALVIEQLARNPDARLGELALIDADDAARLRTWNQTGVADPPGRCIHDLIEEQAAERPHAVAVLTDGELVSYGELDRRANKLAHRLGNEGVEPGDRVGLCLDRSVDMVVGLLGILKAGAAYVPIDPGHPEVRRQELFRDVGVTAIVTDDLGGGFEDEPPEVIRDGGQIAYVIYTSGSTGRPKGVKVTHHNLVSSTRARNHHYGEGPERFLLLSPVSFDSSAVGLFWTLCTGGTLVLPAPGLERDMERLGELIADQSITHVLALPSVYSLLLEAADADRLGSLRVAIVAGESCAPGTVDRHVATIPGVELHNEYGPTETTVWSTVARLDASDATNPVPIGRPIANTTAHVLDLDLRPVPVGFPGELFVAGAGVTAGYLDRPDLTAERFVEVDASGDGPERMYRTGDLVAHRRDGSLLHLGRSDSQVKVRGHRIETAEVEAALVSLDGVAEAAVVGREVGSARRMQLVAYVVGTHDPADGQLRTRLRQTLPDYMVPSHYLTLDALPHLPNGKIDLDSLPDGSTISGDRLDRYVAPRTDSERVLADLWADLLGVEQVGVHDDFFELGGDSLLTIQLTSRARQSGLDVEPRHVAESPTIARLAELADRQVDSAWECLVPLQAAGDRPPLFCVHAGELHVLIYRHLAKRLGRDQPVVGLEPIGLDGRQAPLETFEEIAAAYAAEVRAAYPEGPYRLLGYSFGGSVSLEMARQLEAAGQEVDLLVVVDSGLPHPDRLAPAGLAKVRQILGKEGVGSLVGRAVARRSRRAGRSAAVRSGRAEPDVAKQWVSEACQRAFNSYVPKPCEAPITLIRSTEYLARRDKQHHLEWADFTPRFEVHVVDAPHLQLLYEPEVERIAAVVKALLDRLEVAATVGAQPG